MFIVIFPKEAKHLAVDDCDAATQGDSGGQDTGLGDFILQRQTEPRTQAQRKSSGGGARAWAQRRWEVRSLTLSQSERRGGRRREAEEAEEDGTYGSGERHGQRKARWDRKWALSPRKTSSLRGTWVCIQTPQGQGFWTPQGREVSSSQTFRGGRTHHTPGQASSLPDSAFLFSPQDSQTPSTWTPGGRGSSWAPRPPSLATRYSSMTSVARSGE